MLVTVNKVKVKDMVLHESNTSQMTSSKKLVTQTLFRVSNEIGLILVLSFLGNNLSKEFGSLSKKASGKKTSRKKK